MGTQIKECPLNFSAPLMITRTGRRAQIRGQISDLNEAQALTRGDVCRPVISAIWRCSAPAGGFVKMQRAGCETPMCAYTTHRLKNASTTHSAFLISKSTLRLCFYCSPLAFILRVTGKFNVLFSNKLSALCKSGVSI